MIRNCKGSDEIPWKITMQATAQPKLWKLARIQTIPANRTLRATVVDTPTTRHAFSSPEYLNNVTFTRNVKKIP